MSQGTEHMYAWPRNSKVQCKDAKVQCKDGSFLTKEFPVEETDSI
jgi:hypothetical protein